MILGSAGGMKEIIEEYGAVVTLAIIGGLVIGGFIRIVTYMSEKGLF